MYIQRICSRHAASARSASQVRSCIYVAYTLRSTRPVYCTDLREARPAPVVGLAEAALNRRGAQLQPCLDGATKANVHVRAHALSVAAAGRKRHYHLLRRGSAIVVSAGAAVGAISAVGATGTAWRAHDAAWPPERRLDTQLDLIRVGAGCGTGPGPGLGFGARAMVAVGVLRCNRRTGWDHLTRSAPLGNSRALSSPARSSSEEGSHSRTWLRWAIGGGP